MRIRLTGVNTVRKRLVDGTIRLHRYHRATGERLQGAPGSPEFLASFAAAERLLKDRHAGTFNGLVRDYTLSPEFDRRADSTKREYRRLLAKAEREFGTMPMAALNDPRVRKDLMEWRALVAKVSGEREADNRLSAISAMLTWAKDNGRLTANHLAGFKRLYHSDRADKIWTRDHIDRFMAVAPVEVQRAMILALHTGQRQGDIRTLLWSAYDGHAIRLRQAKTGANVAVPCTAALRQMLDEAPRTAAVILTTRTGRPWTARYFGRAWDDAASAAGITDLHFHDLRGTAVTLLAEAGCTLPQIVTVTGHSLRGASAILERYLARTATLATEAITRLENASSTKFANRLQTDPTTRAKRGPK